MERNKDHFLFEGLDHLVTQERFKVYWDTNREVAWTDIELNQPMDRYYDSAAYDSHKGKRKSVLDALYGLVQQFMFRYKWSKITAHKQDFKNHLDFGGGMGGFSAHTQSKVLETVIIENNDKALAFLKDAGKTAHKNLTDLKPNESFDLITLWHVLEHIPNPIETLENLYNRLNQQGLLVVAVPNFKALDAQHYSSYWAGYDLPRHLWHFSTPGLGALLQQIGFQPIAQYPLFFDAFYVALLSERNKIGKHQFFSAFYQGLRSNLAALKTNNYSSSFFVWTK